MPSLTDECEVKTLFKVGGQREYRWTVKPVSSLPTSGARKDIRCRHCHGRVRVHKQQVAGGPTDHVEHLSHDDTVRCRAGSNFAGEHHMSDDPVI